MRFVRAVTLTMACLALPPSAMAQEGAPDPGLGEAAPEPEEPGKDIVVEGELAKKQKKVCRSETQTGSIMSKRVCYTVAQLEERERIAKYIKEELSKKQMRDDYLRESARNR